MLCSGVDGGVVKVVRVMPTESGFDVDWSRYPDYLRSVRDRMPKGALAYAEALWHYDVENDACPRGFETQSLQVVRSKGVGEDVLPGVEIHLRLRQAGINLSIEFFYSKVQIFRTGIFRFGDNELFRGYGHWLADEVLVDDSGLVTHEVQFRNGDLLVECSELTATLLQIQ